MGLLGDRRTELLSMEFRGDNNDFVHMEFLIPARGFSVFIPE